MDITSFEGQTFGPYPMRVCQEKVAEFVAATRGEKVRWTTAAPPGYLACALFVVAPELLDQLHRYTVIHGEQTFTWAGELKVEQDLLVSGTVTRVRERAGSYFVSFVMTVTDAGAEIATGSSLFLVSGTVTGNTESASESLIGVDQRGDSDGSRQSASRSDLVKYAAATRDWNPIHWDHDTAVSAGLEGVVVHGLLQAAWALDYAAADISGNRPFESARIRFRNPLYPGSPVTLASEGADGKVSVVIAAGDTQFLTAQIVLSGQ